MKTYHLVGKPPYFTNCYMVCSDKGRAVLIDCSADPREVEKVLENERVKLRAVLLTHGHRDHIETLEEIRDKYGCPVYLAREDAQLYWVAGTRDYPRGDGDEKRYSKLRIEDLTFRCIFTPGHTPGGVCLVCGDMLFSGDTLFAGTVGRTDMDGGDFRRLQRSLATLCSLIKRDLRVLPGHDHFSSFYKEKQDNPYLKGL